MQLSSPPMSNGDDQPQGGFDRFPRSSAGVGSGSLFDEPRHRVPPVPPPPGSVFEDPTIPVDRSAYLSSEPARSRILEPEAWGDESDPFPYGPAATYARPMARSELFAERHAPPFAPAGPHREADVPPLERLLEGAYRWRSLLGLGLAALMTVAIVVAYRGASGNEVSDVAVAGDGQTGAAFGDTTASSTVALSGSLPGADQQVGSSVGEVASTTQFPSGPTQTSAPATVRSTSTTARNTSSSSTAGSTPTSTPSSSTPTSTPASSTPTSTPTSQSTSSSPPTSQSTSSTSGSTGSTTSTSLNTRAHLEAESGTLLGGAQVASDHEGYTDKGFVSDIVAPGRGVTVTAKDMAPGATTVKIRYAAGNTALASPRRLTLRVNGVDVKGGVTMANTASWTEWKTVTVDIDLKEGDNTLTLILANGDNGVVNIDYLEIG